MGKPTTANRRAAQLPSGVRDLVRHASDSLGISLEVWDGPARSPERLALAPACEDCEQQQARVFDRCRKRRTYLSRREARVAIEVTERCPLRLRLARLGTPDGEGPTLFGFGSWNALLHRYPTALISPFALLIPVTGLASGALFLGETLTPLQALGGVLVLAGLAINVFGPRLLAVWRSRSA